MSRNMPMLPPRETYRTLPASFGCLRTSPRICCRSLWDLPCPWDKPLAWNKAPKISWAFRRQRFSGSCSNVRYSAVNMAINISRSKGSPNRTQELTTSSCTPAARSSNAASSAEITSTCHSESTAGRLCWILLISFRITLSQPNLSFMTLRPFRPRSKFPECFRKPAKASPTISSRVLRGGHLLHSKNYRSKTKLPFLGTRKNMDVWAISHLLMFGEGGGNSL